METHDIAVLDLSTRAYKCLKRAGIHTVEQLADTPDDELLSIRYFGSQSLDEVRHRLHVFDVYEHGYLY